ncbi:asparagine synthase-related protein [Novosphingobium sp.]|uniref:asparagine synthase-related protein n=1 Tax=Novosphingobium sp. TaxID=1874826 RepID=UPI0025D40979|nr:asparagine synthase-related protein [Novosphingobium sp.]
MKNDRFLAAIGLSEADRAQLLAAASRNELTIAFETPEVVVACNDPAATLQLNDDGLVIGPVYQSGNHQRLTALSDDTRRAILKSAGTRLFEAFWGAYVGILRTPNGASLVRAPFGRLPCLFQRKGPGTIAASDIDLLRSASGTPFILDFEEITRQLALGDMRLVTTSLSGIEELRGGSRLLVEPAGMRLENVWSPWSSVAAGKSIDNADDAVRRLRQQCIASVAARTSDLSNPLLMLSGGLDSSILAASLAADDRTFSCLNLATRDHAGDEREFARRVAQHVKRPLEERRMAVAEYDFARIGAVRTPRPVARGYQQLVFEMASQVAGELGCDGVVDGGGGDNVFCSLRSAAFAADCLIDPDGIHHFRQVRDDIAHLAGAARWRVSWKARRRAWQGARPYKLQGDSRLLARDAQALADTGAVHPWLAPPEFALPGRGAHIAILIAAQGYVEDGPHGTKLNCIAPLVTQPLIELCLAIPSWHWFARGNNRAAARTAFETLLPPEIAWRQGKGNPESFLFSLLERNRAAITDHLLGGILASAGVIDTTALARALRDTERLTGTTYGRILHLLDAETWARGIMEN